ncbi:hypothetical protein [Peterkaempfera griseoplana]|uniref:hypothetical protein n=1 Tax=Peterkaempfera griseoplana TaxID=66896 RepID=UPI0006E2971B|nr:hypothetical protein [Peterkaempfera griseoplana]
MTRETGLSWLSHQCEELTDLPELELDRLIEQGPVSAMVLTVERAAAELDRSVSLQLGSDLRCLLESSLPEETIRTAWAGSTDYAFDPVKEGVAPRIWLKRIESVWLAAERRRDPNFVPPSARPVTDEALRAEVLRVMRPLADGLTAAHTNTQVSNPSPLPPLLPALQRVVTEACADLGYRLFLRAVKFYTLPVGEALFTEMVALGGRLGHPAGPVEDDHNRRDEQGPWSAAVR